MTKPRILLTRLSHIGDCILTLPLLRQIRRKFPKAYIVWAVEKPSNQLLENHPDLDEVLIVPKDWLHSIDDIRNLRRQLKSIRFDISIDPQSMLKSSALAWLSGAKYRVGLRGQHSRELSRCFNNRCILSEKTHLVDRSLDLMTSFGEAPQPAEFELPICPVARAYVSNWIETEAVSDESLVSSFYTINPGASWKSKLWHNDRFAAAACEIKKRTGMTGVISWAGREELSMAEEISSLSAGAAIPAPKTTLKQLAALLNKSEFYLGCDTGPMHIANAVGTKCIGLFGTTRPQDSGPYGPQHVNVQRWYQSGTCRQRRQSENEAMSDITVDDVVAACREITSVESAPSNNVIRREILSAA